MKKILVVMICLMCIMLNACKKEVLPETPIIGLGGDSWAQGPLDEYIKTNFTDPLNIQVKYKWDPYETKYNKNMAPVKEEVVIPVLDATQKIWIEPYAKHAGMDFMRQLAPKLIVLIGSAEWNSDNTITLGEAEGGKRISLLVSNSYDRKNAPIVKQMLHTINHEFAHILHQNINYPRDFKRISERFYTSSWFNTTNEEANAQGLVTAYAKVGADDDFVETIAYLLVEGQVAFDKIVADNPGEAAATLRLKESIVVDYYRTAYKIDFRALQAEVLAAFIAISQ
jgi:substrate import-associated zinc metallohydrolase lipoprotein